MLGSGNFVIDLAQLHSVNMAAIGKKASRAKKKKKKSQSSY